MSRPSIGSVVHYTSYGTSGGEYGKECRAAIVTAVPDTLTGGLYGKVPDVHLCVLNPEGFFFNKGVQHHDPGDGETRRGGTWHWPETAG